jgi:hypothetical protein
MTSFGCALRKLRLKKYIARIILCVNGRSTTNQAKPLCKNTVAIV